MTPVDEPELHEHVVDLQELIVSLIEIGKKLNKIRYLQKESMVKEK